MRFLRIFDRIFRKITQFCQLTADMYLWGMRICVAARFLLPEYLEGLGLFTYSVVQEWVKTHPQHQFLVVTDRPIPQHWFNADNVEVVVKGPEARHPLLWKWWYDVQLARAAKQFKADVLVCPDGFAAKTSRIPQVMVVHDVAFLEVPQLYQSTHLLFYRKLIPGMLAKATVLATVSAFTKTDLQMRFPSLASKPMPVVYNGVRPIFQPLSWEAREAVKAKYSGGKEYFICVGSIHPRKNPIALLKAFSAFKKRQQSNMQLLFVGRLAWHSDEFMEKYNTFKYRSDVHLLGYQPEEVLKELVGAAYALVYPSQWEGFGVPPVEAMQAGVPVITTMVSSMPEIGGEAALYVPPNDPQELALAMMRLYKDESLRNQLVAKGIHQAAQYSWPRTAQLLWEAVELAAKR